jgi:hypothetical protein
MTTLTWEEAVVALAEDVDDSAFLLRAEAFLARVGEKERERVLLDSLISDARRVRRLQTLGAERSAEARGALHRTTAEEWEEAARERSQKYREKKERERQRIAQGIAQRQELGLPEDASAGLVLQAALDRMVAELKMEWTQELLDSTFALSDGSRVTWGNATVEEHRERARMFTDLAETNLHGAARHKLAIDQLVRAGATCLNEVVMLVERCD